MWRLAIASRRCDFVAKTTCLLPVPKHRSPVFPCPRRSDESRSWWEVDLEHASSRVMAAHRLELYSRSKGSGLLGYCPGFPAVKMQLFASEQTRKLTPNILKRTAHCPALRARCSTHSAASHTKAIGSFTWRLCFIDCGQ